MTDKPPEKAKQESGKSGPTLEQRIADLELANAQLRAGTPLGTIPDHGAGPGQDVEETWSQAQQEAEQAADNE